MTNKLAQAQTPSTPQSQAIEQIQALFRQCQHGELVAHHTMAQARKFEKQVAKLVAKVTSLAPNSVDHCQALAYHEYTLLSLSRTSQRPAVAKSLRTRAYNLGAASVAIQFAAEKKDISTVFAGYNLAIDLIVGERRTWEGLQWMLKARDLFRTLTGKKKLPSHLIEFKLYAIDYGIARAHYDLGNALEARRILKRALSYAPALNSADWSTLRGIAKCSELLAQIHLDVLEAKPAVNR